MSQVPNSIGVNAPIAPLGSNDNYPTHFAKFGKGGYFAVDSYAELTNHPEARLEIGMLGYVRDQESFYLYTGSGWQTFDPLNVDAIIPNTLQKALNSSNTFDTIPSLQPEFIRPEDLPEFLINIDRGSKYIIYVDPNHPNATDSKRNIGNSPSQPFKTIERACLEAVRKSVRPGGSGAVPNDIAEKVTIYLAPGEYVVENGKGGSAIDPSYGRRQDAAKLLLVNKDWMVERAAAAADIDFLSQELQDKCKRDLGIFVTAVANDISLAGTYYTYLSANALRPGGDFIDAYDSTLEREKTQLAIDSLIADTVLAITNEAGNEGGKTLPGIIEDPSPNPCNNIVSEATTLLGILKETLNPNNTSMPPELENASTGFNTANFPDEGEPTGNDLRGFNNITRGGIILPRGISIIGGDLRKVIIRPKYVPAKNGSEGRSAIFRMTGGNFFSGFTVLDNADIKRSHHNLSCFEFCSQADLDDYYDKIALVFRDDKSANELFDASNLIFANTGWISKKIKELKTSSSQEEALLKKFGKYTRLLASSLSMDLRDKTSDKFKNAAFIFKESVVDNLTGNSGVIAAAKEYIDEFIRQFNILLIETISNRANVGEGGYIDEKIPLDKTSPFNPCQDVQAIIHNFTDLFKAIINEDAEVEPFSLANAIAPIDIEPVESEYNIVGELGTNTVEGASPYIFSASLRSIYGICGIDGNGSTVGGFKSYLAAQFTVISLQVDPDAFISDINEVGGKRYRGSLSTDAVDYRHFGYRVTNDAYTQLVSCFCIGPAVHYWAEDGSEMSITNSTSNFGDVSLYARGYREEAYPQDKGYKWLGVRPPKVLDTTPRNIGVGGFSRRRDTSLALRYIVLDNVILEDSLDGYSLKPGSRVYIRRLDPNLSEGFEELYATVGSYDQLDINSLDAPLNRIIPISEYGPNWPAIGGLGEIVLNGSNIYIKRIIDTRGQEDRIHKVLVEAPLTNSRERPVENFLFNFDLNGPINSAQLPFGQNSVFYIAKVDEAENNTSTGAKRFYLTLLNAYSDAEGAQDSNSGYYPILDLDYDPVAQSGSIVTNPSSSKTYDVLDRIFTFLGFNNTQKNNALGLSNSDNIFASQDEQLVEFKKPTVIRCGGQTWEYCGYYNYNTSVPAFQTSQMGVNLNDEQTYILRLSKLKTQKSGGRIYSTGLDEEGNFYIGTRVINVRTGEESDVRNVGSEDANIRSYLRLNIAEALNMAQGSNLRLSGGSTLRFDSESLLSINSTQVRAQITLEEGGLEVSSPGFARPAVTREIREENEFLSGATRGYAYVTPQGLGDWRREKQLVTQRTGITRIYIGYPGSVSINNAYYTRFWPEPPFPDVAVSSNPGADYRSLRTLADAAAWANRVLTPTETAELIIAPGRYNLSATFNCNVIINGANGIGGHGAPDDPSQSVIFYRNPAIELHNDEFGERTLRGLTVNGRLLMRGPGESIIKRVFLENPFDSYKIRNNVPSNLSAIEHLLRSTLSREYSNVFTPEIRNYVIPSNLIRVFTNIHCLVKLSGSLELENVIFYPQGGAPPKRRIIRYYPVSSLITLLDADLTMNGCAFRGTDSFVIPRSISSDVLGDNNNSYNITNNENVNWAPLAYFSDKDGNYQTPVSNPNYVSLLGHMHSAIGINGNCTLRFGNSIYRRGNSISRNHRNDDRNNIRLEKNHKENINFTTVNTFGDHLLGDRGLINYSDSDISQFNNDIKNTLGPIFTCFLYVDRQNSNLNIGGFSNGIPEVPENHRPGWRGSFSYIPLFQNNQFAQKSLKVIGLSYRLSRNFANSTIISRFTTLSLPTISSFDTLWRSLPREDDGEIDFSVPSLGAHQSANMVNVYAIDANPGTYTYRQSISPDETNSFVDTSNNVIVEQKSEGSDVDNTYSIVNDEIIFNNNRARTDFGDIAETANIINSTYKVVGLTVSRFLTI